MGLSTPCDPRGLSVERSDDWGGGMFGDFNEADPNEADRVQPFVAVYLER